MLSIVVGPGPLTDAAAEKHPGLLQTQDFSPASDCDLAMPQSDTKSFVGAPESPSGASGAPQKKGGLAQFIQHVLGYKFLLLGVGSAVAIWIVLQLLNLTIFSHIAFLAAEILASLLLIRIGADIAASGNVGHTLNAIWLPVVVVAVAAYLLFFNDQGRELGLGLMGANQTVLFALAVTLIYWALNSWLSARIGLSREFPEPEKGQVLLFWGPRLLGVCA